GEGPQGGGGAAGAWPPRGPSRGTGRLRAPPDPTATWRPYATRRTTGWRFPAAGWPAGLCPVRRPCTPGTASGGSHSPGTAFPPPKPSAAEHQAHLPGRDTNPDNDRPVSTGNQ